MSLVERCRRLVASPRFQAAVLALIFANAVLIGLETSRTVMARQGEAIVLVSAFIQASFVLEIVLRLASCWPRLHAFFHDGWNVFDFSVVAASLLPVAGPFATIARLARVLRVSRLVSVWPDLRLIIGTMLRSIPSMGHVIALMTLLLYVYGVLGFHLFHTVAPEYWGTLPLALKTLFQTLTLEGWIEVADRSRHPLAGAYFTSFIVIAVFVVTNLFIAVVINNLEQVRSEQTHAADEASVHRAVLARIEALKTELDELETALRRGQSKP